MFASSNGAVNLCPDKKPVLQEAYRVLKVYCGISLPLWTFSFWDHLTTWVEIKRMKRSVDLENLFVKLYVYYKYKNSYLEMCTWHIQTTGF